MQDTQMVQLHLVLLEERVFVDYMGPLNDPVFYDMQLPIDNTRQVI